MTRKSSRGVVSVSRNTSTDPASLAPDLRPAVLSVIGRYADEKTWNKLHELGLKTTSIADKQNYYNALAEATDPKLVKKTLPDCAH